MCKDFAPAHGIFASGVGQILKLPSRALMAACPILSAHARGRAHGRRRLRGGPPRVRAAAGRAAGGPSARPAERRAVKQDVADIQPRAGVEEQRRERDDLLVSDPVAERRGLVQRRLAEARSHVRIAARQEQPQAFDMRRAVECPGGEAVRGRDGRGACVWERASMSSFRTRPVSACSG